MRLHRMTLLAARGPDAATVKRIGSSARREVRSLLARPAVGLGHEHDSARQQVKQAVWRARLTALWEERHNLPRRAPESERRRGINERLLQISTVVASRLDGDARLVD
jgi:hypothetical protein